MYIPSTILGGEGAADNVISVAQYGKISNMHKLLYSFSLILAQLLDDITHSL